MKSGIGSTDEKEDVAKSLPNAGEVTLIGVIVIIGLCTTFFFIKMKKNKTKKSL